VQGHAFLFIIKQNAGKASPISGLTFCLRLLAQSRMDKFLKQREDIHALE
jgi:hypothetical protein